MTENVTDIQNPTDLSDYDWLEFVSFVWKVEREGFSYAAEEYRPKFEAEQMQEVARSYESLRDFHRTHAAKVDTWAEQIGGERACDLTNDHVDECRQREEDACLWGIRCTDGYVIAVPTRQARDSRAARLLNNPREGRRVPAALLHRVVAGGEWTETALI